MLVEYFTDKKTLSDTVLRKDSSRESVSFDTQHQIVLSLRGLCLSSELIIKRNKYIYNSLIVDNLDVIL